MTKRALITGISGQDGAYLAKSLLAKGYEVHGTSRDRETTNFWRLERLGVRGNVTIHSMSITELHSVLHVLKLVQPDEVYNLAGQSSVSLSFEQPLETMTSNVIGTLNLLESMRFFGSRGRLYNAASSESFGDVGGVPAVIGTPFAPRSPYAVAKATAFWEVANYREAYGLHACSGVLFNHESPLRSPRFVTRKIVAAACRIAAGSGETLHLGNIDVQRDWGWAEEYVEAMWRMMQQPEPRDYVIATGVQSSLRDFVREAFACVGLDWQDHVHTDPALFRPSDIASSVGDPRVAHEELGWKATMFMPDVVREMVRHEQAMLAGEEGAPGMPES
ncbi:GDP-mannose 4,6-dehydratase [Desulfovibrio mangrovi]|uniref:GDP-mannose 4,6-dehydratase n=1 Tax=Desulfovibrio mangrovi TaxID=2976983 RepID=UPI0022451E08|nr:GDP-mannose 4,6-dehydratase [Desulfovibrio mangrovi]UZP66151.1 GDP-mannose 4,6-dehydratase [Desulfovibrio mangrovi]